MAKVSVIHFSDVLCVWAYVGQIKVDELERHFHDRVEVETRFVPVFGDNASRWKNWESRGGRDGYARHVREVVADFDQVTVNDDTWARVAPAGSWSTHTFLRAADLALSDGHGPTAEDPERRRPLEDLAWEIRLAFFRDARDIGRRDVQLDVALARGWPTDAIVDRLDDGSALAALAADHDLATRNRVTGSPTFVFNEGRQQLYGNVGYKILAANVEELLRDNSDRASWC